MPSQSRNRRQQRRRSLKMRGGEEKDIMDKLVEIEGKIDGLNSLIMQSNPTEEVPQEVSPVEDEVHNEDAAGDLKTVTPESNIDDESNNKLETPEMPENGSEMPENGSEMPEIKSENGSEMPENGSEMSETGSENDSEIKSEGGRRNSRRRRQRNNRKSQRRQQRR